MKRLKLVLPSPEYKKAILDYKSEFIKEKEEMHGSACLDKTEYFEEWYKGICNNSNEETVKEGFVPASTFLALSTKNNHIIGMIDIRHRLNDYLLKCGGHIGFSIRSSERQKGYATEMLKLALEKCEELNIGKALVTCYKENTASRKTILNNNGILENEILEANKVIQRYWIDIN